MSAGYHYDGEFPQELEAAVDHRRTQAEGDIWPKSAVVVTSSLAWWMDRQYPDSVSESP